MSPASRNEVGGMRNIDYLKSLAPRELARAILSLAENSCIACPRERERRCNEDCAGGLKEWLLAAYIPGSTIWNQRRKKS